MGIFGMVRRKMGQATEYRRAVVQASTEQRAKALEAEAAHARKLKVQLERQQAAQADIDAVREIRTRKIRGAIKSATTGLKKYQKQQKKKHGNTGPQFGLGSSGGSPFDVTVNYNNNKKNKGPKFGL